MTSAGYIFQSKTKSEGPHLALSVIMVGIQMNTTKVHK